MKINKSSISNVSCEISFEERDLRLACGWYVEPYSKSPKKRYVDQKTFDFYHN